MVDIRRAVAALAKLYRPGRILSDPLQLILWDNIGYLIDDERRAALFDEFAERVGLDAEAILKAKASVLSDIAKRGGMNPGQRVERWKTIASICASQPGGDLFATLKGLPAPKRRALLKKFPAIGDPGADKILLFSGLEIRPALESNGLRTLLRLGLTPVEKSYGATHKAAVAVLAAEGETTRAWFMRAYSALRAHGQTLCKRTTPQCLACPLDPTCAHVMMASGY
jgi:endonuclease III